MKWKAPGPGPKGQYLLTCPTLSPTFKVGSDPHFSSACFRWSPFLSCFVPEHTPFLLAVVFASCVSLVFKVPHFSFLDRIRPSFGIQFRWGLHTTFPGSLLYQEKKKKARCLLFLFRIAHSGLPVFIMIISPMTSSLVYSRLSVAR